MVLSSIFNYFKPYAVRVMHYVDLSLRIDLEGLKLSMINQTMAFLSQY